MCVESMDSSKAENLGCMVYSAFFPFVLLAIHARALAHPLAIDYVGTVELKDESVGPVPPI
jgi:hypothetical protein